MAPLAGKEIFEPGARKGSSSDGFEELRQGVDVQFLHLSVESRDGVVVAVRGLTDGQVNQRWHRQQSLQIDLGTYTPNPPFDPPARKRRG